MRVIIAGSRGITDAARLNRAILASQFDISYVVCGMAEGVDLMGRAWAKRQEPKVPVMEMPANWEGLGKRAGAVRNCAMAKEAEGLIALWDGKSSGTRHMITEAVSKGLYHYIDATCAECGGDQGIAIYFLITPAEPKPQLRAQCRDCLIRKAGPDSVTYFDVFRMWDNHTLHVTEKRMKIGQSKVPPQLPPRAVVPKLQFGNKAESIKEYKKWKELEPESQQNSLY